MFPSDRTGDEDGLSQDPGALGDRARGLQARRDRLEAEEAELLIEVEGLRARGRDSCRDTAAWLRQNTGIARATARTRAHVARQLAAVPGARVALAEGRIGFDHARVLADHADSPHRDNLLDHQAEIVGWAVELPADGFRDRMADWARDVRDPPPPPLGDGWAHQPRQPRPPSAAITITLCTNAAAAPRSCPTEPSASSPSRSPRTPNAAGPAT